MTILCWHCESSSSRCRMLRLGVWPCVMACLCDCANGLQSSHCALLASMTDPLSLDKVLHSSMYGSLREPCVHSQGGPANFEHHLGSSRCLARGFSHHCLRVCLFSPALLHTSWLCSWALQPVSLPVWLTAATQSSRSTTPWGLCTQPRSSWAS